MVTTTRSLNITGDIIHVKLPDITENENDTARSACNKYQTDVCKEQERGMGWNEWASWAVFGVRRPLVLEAEVETRDLQSSTIAITASSGNWLLRPYLRLHLLLAYL